MGYEVQILVVDNGSNDGTGELARKAGAEVLVEPRKGKGNAVRTAFKTVDADFICMFDADNTYPVACIPDMLRLLNHSDVVMGSRLKGRREKGAMSRLNLVGNYLLSLMATILYQRKTSDVCTGCWGFNGEVVKNLNLQATGFELEADLFSQLTRKGHSIVELPIYYRQRASSPKLNSLKDGIKIGWALITRRFCD
ncbi:MAG: Undecaprenyl-phosphate mannosyltransferase [Firmicutes bacterium]|nr:Undecaprenyl-phosphate mannosyltransferase [Bacillota bacterium]